MRKGFKIIKRWWIWTWACEKGRGETMGRTKKKKEEDLDNTEPKHILKITIPFTMLFELTF